MREDLTGRRYGRLTVCRDIKQAEKSRRHYWLCRCDCGKEKTVEESHLKTGHTKSCGCYRKELPSSRRIDLTGRQFGRLKVLEEADNSNRTGEYWKCVCSCGRLIEVSKESLCAGKTKSCGCLQAETRKENMKKAIHFVYNLGTFVNLEDAVAARKKAEEELYEPFLREHGVKEVQKGGI